jgi:hypothetical protein
MRIPERHFRQRTRQWQLRAGDLVTALRVGLLRGGVIGGGWAAHGTIRREQNRILSESPPAHLPAFSIGSTFV